MGGRPDGIHRAHRSEPRYRVYSAVHRDGRLHQKDHTCSSYDSLQSDMKDRSCLPWLRYGIFTANIVFIVVGGLLLTMGIWLRSDSRFRDFLSERYRQVVDEAFWEAPTLYAFSYITIILGCCMIIVAFLGCCGVNAENRALLIVYAMAVFLLLVATLSCGIYLFYKKDGIDVELSDALNYMVQHYYQGAGIIQESLDRLQTTFRCCGNAGCSDFRAFRQDPPRSCDIRCDGCHYRIWVALKIGFSITLVVFFIVVICQVLALVFGLYIVFIRPEQVHMVYVDRERDSKSEPRRLVTETLQKHNVPCNLKKAGHGRN